MNVNEEVELRARIAELTGLLEESERHVAELRGGVARIIWVLKEKQPEPRSASVTYVSGYARAMDDMRRVIMDVVSKETVTQAREVRSNFTDQARLAIEGEVAARAVVEDEDRPADELMTPVLPPKDDPIVWYASTTGPAGPFSDLKSRITYWPVNDGAWPPEKTMVMAYDDFGNPSWIG